MLCLIGINVAHAQDTSPTVVKQPVTINLAQKGWYVELSFEAEKKAAEISYQWYQSDTNSNTSGVAIDGATFNVYNTEVLTDKEIRYYYCVATADDGTSVTSNVATVAYTGLPTVLIETVDGVEPLPDKVKVNGRMYLIKEGNIIYDSGSKNEFTIKVRGNATAYYPKRPYKLKLPKKANLLADAPFSATENKDKNWVLLAGYCDKTLLRNKIGFYVASLFNDIHGNEQLYVPHCEFVDVILNGEYLGNYCLTDAVKRVKTVSMSMRMRTTMVA